MAWFLYICFIFFFFSFHIYQKLFVHSRSVSRYHIRCLKFMKLLQLLEQNKKWIYKQDEVAVADSDDNLFAFLLLLYWKPCYSTSSFFSLILPRLSYVRIDAHCYVAILMSIEDTLTKAAPLVFFFLLLLL